MTQSNEAPRQARTDSDRRGTDRRNVERRAPPPPWRRPWAFALYGVAGALVLMLVWRGLRGDDTPAPKNDAPLVAREPGSPGPAPAETPPAQRPPADGPAQEAYGAAGF
ncbi:MAG: hypothetical protein ICV87_01355, partial [Gemmatimonadetes bacterium]|nr:hypothetical protein [Gemmatimonadota bacterium]